MVYGRSWEAYSLLQYTWSVKICESGCDINKNIVADTTTYGYNTANGLPVNSTSSSGSGSTKTSSSGSNLPQAPTKNPSVESTTAIGPKPTSYPPQQQTSTPKPKSTSSPKPKGTTTNATVSHSGHRTLDILQ